VERILVAGTSGSGKTTVARALSRRLGIPHHELDALHHGPGWVKRADFEDDVARFAATDAWVTEDQYHRFLGDLLWERADTVIWLDLPRRTVLQRVLRRSMARAVSRRELWNGNRENALHWLDADHPIRWSMSQYSVKRAGVQQRAGHHPHVDVLRFRSAGEVRRWLRGVGP
jgi:adenylate kinase family enzyme